jgi:hypothetical protein
MRPAGLDKWLGIAGLALIVGATLVASRDYEASSTTRRGQGAESFWYGAQAILGVEDPGDGGLIWLARLMALAGVAVLALWGWRKARGRTVAPHPRPPAR